MKNWWEELIILDDYDYYFLIIVWFVSEMSGSLI